MEIFSHLLIDCMVRFWLHCQVVVTEKVPACEEHGGICLCHTPEGGTEFRHSCLESASGSCNPHWIVKLYDVKLPLAHIALLPSGCDSSSTARNQTRSWEGFCQRCPVLGLKNLSWWCLGNKRTSPGWEIYTILSWCYMKVSFQWQDLEK